MNNEQMDFPNNIIDFTYAFLGFSDHANLCPVYLPMYELPNQNEIPITTPKLILTIKVIPDANNLEPANP